MAANAAGVGVARSKKLVMKIPPLRKISGFRKSLGEEDHDVKMRPDLNSQAASEFDEIPRKRHNHSDNASSVEVKNVPTKKAHPASQWPVQSRSRQFGGLGTLKVARFEELPPLHHYPFFS
jgi:hypothetical protein